MSKIKILVVLLI